MNELESSDASKATARCVGDRDRPYGRHPPSVRGSQVGRAAKGQVLKLEQKSQEEIERDQSVRSPITEGFYTQERRRADVRTFAE